MATQKNKTDSQPEPTFEEALERLETLVGQMEDGTLGLDDLMARFEEGQALIRLCSGKLNEVEKKVELLMKKGEGVEGRPFADGAPGAEGPDK